jgi:YVTN family beta-propeller protein
MRATKRSFGLTALGAVALAAAGLALASESPAPAAGPPVTQEVIFAGNNWEGTASVLDPSDGYQEIARINIVPDEAERMLEIMLNPADLAYFLAIRQAVGEGHDQFVDDMYTTPDGELLIVSRPSFKDVVGIALDDCTDLNACDIAWRFEVAGQRSDHMALSPDGSTVAVSASTGNVVHILDTQTGAEIDQFASGDSPHENTYSKNGKRLYHASIGRVYVPNQEGNIVLDTTKGERVFYVMDTDDYTIKKDIDIREELDKAGRPDLSEAVRPMALSPNERKVYFQVSFFHGFVVYSFRKHRITRIVDLPNFVPNLPKEQYVLNSAHHGIAINGRGTRLCVAGTMSDYAAIVQAKAKQKARFKILRKGTKPYWSTTSSDGRKCYVSWSGTDTVSVISYGTRKEIAHIPVGDHPQRVRTGQVTTDWIATHGN